MVKAIFFDVDGTLVSHKTNTVPESARSALDLLAQKGIRRILATGRSRMELSKLPVKDILFDAYITLNGQLGLDDRGQILFESPITGAEKEQLLRLFREKRIPIVLVEKDRMYINFHNRYVQLAQQAVSTPLPPIGSYRGAEIYLAVAYLDRHSDGHILQQLSGCNITWWNEYAVDIVAASGGKRSGIREYLEKTGIRLEETMAFGDGENDIDMLEYVHTGVAMGNADAPVKEIADHVTDTVDRDGIWKALIALNVIDGSGPERK